MSLDPGSSEHSAASSSPKIHDEDAQKQSGTTSESLPPQSEKESKNSKDAFLVEYEGPDDPLDPQNIAVWKKWSYAVILGLITLSTTFASSVFSTATHNAAEEFGVSNQVMTLGTALFIAGKISVVFIPLIGLCASPHERD